MATRVNTQAHSTGWRRHWHGYLFVRHLLPSLRCCVSLYDHDAEQVLMMMCLPKFGILMSSNIQVELIPCRTLYMEVRGLHYRYELQDPLRTYTDDITSVLIRCVGCYSAVLYRATHSHCSVYTHKLLIKLLLVM